MPVQRVYRPCPCPAAAAVRLGTLTDTGQPPPGHIWREMDAMRGDDHVAVITGVGVVTAVDDLA